MNDPVLKLNMEDMVGMDHSHPDGRHRPSGLVLPGVELDDDQKGDVQVAQLIERHSPGAKFSVYTPSDGKSIFTVEEIYRY